MKIHARFLKVVFLRPNLQKWRYEGYMVCATYRKQGKDQCTSHQIRNSVIE